MDVNNVSSHEEEDHSSHMVPYVQMLQQQIAELQSQSKVQSSIAAMFGNRDKPRQSPSSSRGGKSSAAGRVPNVSRVDYERCRQEGLCINCREKGHDARSRVKPQVLKW